MIGYLIASFVFFGGIVVATIGELVTEEIRGWLDLLPRATLRLAASRLNPADKITIYEDEWLPELTYILREAEARPLSRIIIGIKFSFGLLMAANRIKRRLHRVPHDSSLSGIVMLVDTANATDRVNLLRVQSILARMRVLSEYRAGLACLSSRTRRELDVALACANGPESSEHARRAVDAHRAHLSSLQHQDDSLCAEELSCNAQLHSFRQLIS